MTTTGSPWWFSRLQGSRRVVLLGPFMALMLVAACGGPAATPADPGATPAPTPSPTQATPTPTPPPDGVEATVQAVQHEELGEVLADSEGRILYLFTQDERETSNCTGGCLSAWPPLLTTDDPSAGDGVSAERLGTIEREDGSRQVTYNGWPLYYFAQDTTPAEANGQDFNDVWFVVSPYGGPVQTEAVVTVAEHPDLGEILTDASGRTLYLFTNDAPNTSNCSGDCALNWPPLLTVNAPVAGAGVEGALDSIERPEGGNQVIYESHPLYYFASDAGPGYASGQELGDAWFAVSPEGDAVVAEVAPPATPEVETIQVVARDFEFVPAHLDLREGVTYRFEVIGQGSFHTFTLRDPAGDIVLDVELPAGATETAEFTPAATGSYHLFCRPHEALGMIGTVDVGNGAPQATPTP